MRILLFLLAYSRHIACFTDKNIDENNFGEVDLSLITEWFRKGSVNITVMKSILIALVNTPKSSPALIPKL